MQNNQNVHNEMMALVENVIDREKVQQEAVAMIIPTEELKKIVASNPTIVQLKELAKRYAMDSFGVRINYGVKEDKTKAFELYLKAAQMGDVESMLKVATMMANGSGCSMDYVKAKEWYDKAVATELPKGTTGEKLALVLGVWLFDTFEFPENDTLHFYKDAYQRVKDIIMEETWLSMEDASSNPITCSLLAYSYRLGKGVAKNLEQAHSWYVKAASLGDVGAMYRVGRWYELGLGCAKDIQSAMDWYKKASRENHAYAKYRLGCCYINGSTGKINPEQAEQLFSQAVSLIDSKYVPRFSEDVGVLDFLHLKFLIGRIFATDPVFTQLKNKKLAKKLKREGIELMLDARESGSHLAKTYLSKNFTDEVTLQMYYRIGRCSISKIEYDEPGRNTLRNTTRVALEGDLGRAFYELGCYMYNDNIWKIEAPHLLFHETEEDTEYLTEEDLLGKREDNETYDYRASDEVLEKMIYSGRYKKHGRDARALYYFTLSAKQNYIPAIEKVIEYYTKGIGTDVNLYEADFWRDKLIDLLPQQQLEQEMDLHREQASEFKQNLQAANAGLIWAMKKVSDSYREGLGVEKDEKLAESWEKNWQLAAQKDFEATRKKVGDLWAIKRLSLYYRDGVGVPQNQAEAEKLLAQYNEQFIPLLQAMATEGNPRAKLMLGKILWEENSPEKKAEAVHWLSDFVSSPHLMNRRLEGSARFLLWEAYDEGQGTEQNPELAHKFLLGAAECGHLQACKKVLDMDSNWEPESLGW